MYEIIPNLYLSGYHEAKRYPGIQEFFVVNCTQDLPMISDDNMRVSVNDDGEKQSMDIMFMAFSRTNVNIKSALDKGKKVIVHCLAGQQRSPTVVAVYLMEYCGYSIEDAIRYIRDKKKDAFFWSVNFKDAIQRYGYSLVYK